MGHLRYVIKNGKRYGPYVYHSYRDEFGNVKKHYLGKGSEVKRGAMFSVSVFILLFLFSAGMAIKLIVQSIF